jgi:polysaccharide export outer membrane protein
MERIIADGRPAMAVLLTATLLCSCVSRKDITYFQPVDPSSDNMVARVSQSYVPRIKPGDVISVTVSSISPEASTMFNPLPQQSMNINQNAGSTVQAPVVGYPVDEGGMVTLPILGEVKAVGMTAKEFAGDITRRLDGYLQSPTVLVRIANYQISVLGEVARPALYTITNETVTLPEALAMAGDATVFGKRTAVLIIRETQDGQRQFARVDLTGRELFDTPFYYLHSGDIVYVEPVAGRATSSDRTLQLVPMIISSLSMLLLIFNTFEK